MMLLLADDTDYSRPLQHGEVQTKSALIAAVIGGFGKDLYGRIIQQLINSGGCGDNEANISFDRKKNKAYFYFSFDEDNVATLPYKDAVKLFHAYFNAFKKFIEEYQKEYLKKEWYKRFLEELPRLNKLYEEVVEEEKK